MERMMEAAAIPVLRRALKMDHQEQFTMALVLYQEGAQILLDSVEVKGGCRSYLPAPFVKEKRLTKEVNKSHYLTSKAKQCFDRVKKLKKLISTRKSNGIYRESTKIESGSTGHGYASVFGRFLDGTVTYIEIEDPYIRVFHQCQNLVRLCELAVQKCCVLTKISLLTTCDEADPSQIMRLAELKQSLESLKIFFEFSFSETLHDRQIILSNGWVIKIGRGLDYFKPPEGRFVLGSCDLELRRCMETTVDIFHKNQL